MNTEEHETIMATYWREYNTQYERFLSIVHRSYYRIIHVLVNNHASLVDPKNKLNLGRSAAQDMLFA